MQLDEGQFIALVIAPSHAAPFTRSSAGESALQSTRQEPGLNARRRSLALSSAGADQSRE
jgi:hypothetical protein